MSTRSTIAIKTSTGFSAIYCHNDGSLVLGELQKHFNTLEKAQELIALGSISSIHEGQVVAYSRDRGEDYEDNKSENVEHHWELMTMAHSHDAQYLHIFRQGSESGTWSREEMI